MVCFAFSNNSVISLISSSEWPISPVLSSLPFDFTCVNKMLSLLPLSIRGNQFSISHKGWLAFPIIIAPSERSTGFLNSSVGTALISKSQYRPAATVNVHRVRWYICRIRFRLSGNRNWISLVSLVVQVLGRISSKLYQTKKQREEVMSGRNDAMDSVYDVKIEM